MNLQNKRVLVTGGDGFIGSHLVEHISTSISQIASGSSRIKLGDLRGTRDFTYVDDTCRGFLAIAGLDDDEIFHIGSNAEISVGDLFKLIAETVKSDAQIEIDPERTRPPESEVVRLRCDAQKLRAATGFHPEVGLREGLRRTIDWFRESKNLRACKESLYNV